MTLYQRIKEAGIEHSNHYSDLYIPSTPENRAILKEFGAPVESFWNNETKTRWLDIPFAYDPYWESKIGTKSPFLAEVKNNQ